MKILPAALGLAAVSCLVPLEVWRLGKQHVEGPFGNAFGMFAVMAAGLALAIGGAIVAGLKIRAGREGAAIWIVSAGIALSPILYFIVWNMFFRNA